MTYIRSGQVRYIYRPYLNLGDTFQRMAAEALYCAGEQGKFWEMHDWEYKNVSRLTGGGDVVAVLVGQAAPELGLDGDRLETCLREDRYRSRLQEIMDDALARGVQATPTFLINDRPLEGAAPFEVFRQMIEEKLAK